MSASKFSGPALVARGKMNEGGWVMEDVSAREPGEHELVVEIVASGICHTDAMIGSIDPSPLSYYPRVLGHEGSGYVRAVGGSVKVAAPGDPVLLSFIGCNECHCCQSGHPAVCVKFLELNFGPGAVFTAAADGAELGGRFFGQSSFAQFTVVDERSVVNIKAQLEGVPEAERLEQLRLFAPLGCGIQTGSGTVINVAKPRPGANGDVVAVVGLGGVGLAAVMAAKMLGVTRLIGIDRVQSRLDLAKELGASHVVDTSNLPEGKSLADAVRDVADGLGPTISIDATGVPDLVRAAYDFTRFTGRIFQVGAAPPDAILEVPIFNNMMAGKSYTGICEGDAVPTEYVPKLISWYREKVFPFDRLVKLYPAKDFQTALKDMHDGSTVKPILVWS